MEQLRTIADEMLTVYETSKGEKVIKARELHEQLLVGKVFAAWIQERIEKYGFIENEDFFPISEKTNGRPKTDYILTLDVAKEIAMVQNNEQGRAIRKYFIEVEKRFRQQSKPQSVEDLIILQANSMKELKQRVEQQTQELSDVKHRMDNYDKIDQIGDLQQRLNNMIRKYAADNGVAFPEAWRHFRRSFNTAYRTNIKTLMKNYQSKHGLKSITAPQYLSMANRLDDAIRVADKMLNSQTFLTTR